MGEWIFSGITQCNYDVQHLYSRTKFLGQKNQAVTLMLLPWNHFQGLKQRAMKVVSDNPGLVDFAIGLVNSVVHLPNGQVVFLEQFE